MKTLVRRLLIMATALLTVALSSVFVLSAIGQADVPATVDTYQATAKAAAIRLIAGSSAFPNFNNGPNSTQGAIDNRYPSAAVAQDSAPSTFASGSPADYGPLVAFSLTSPPPQPCDEVPPGTPISPPGCPLPMIPYGAHNPPPNWYAIAQYPNPPGKPDASFSFQTGAQNGANNQPVPACKIGDGGELDCSEVHARELKADAIASYTGGQSLPIQGATADTHTIVNPDGSVVTTAHSHIAYINFGGGQLVIKGLDLLSTVTSFENKAITKSTITIGSITANGQALALTDQGTTIPPPVAPPNPPNPVPGVPNGGNLVVPPPGLAGNFAGEILKVSLIQPVLTKEGPTGTIFAKGLSVKVSTPGIPGYPSNFVEYVLGDNFVQAYGVPAEAFNASLGDLGNVDLGNGGGETPAYSVTTGGESGYTGTTPPNLGQATRPARRNVGTILASFSRPPIAAMFFLWEAMVFAASISLYLARRNRLAGEGA